jgi:hypothetical protein
VFSRSKRTLRINLLRQSNKFMVGSVLTQKINIWNSLPVSGFCKAFSVTSRFQVRGPWIFGDRFLSLRLDFFLGLFWIFFNFLFYFHISTSFIFLFFTSTVFLFILFYLSSFSSSLNIFLFLFFICLFIFFLILLLCSSNFLLLFENLLQFLSL